MRAFNEKRGRRDFLRKGISGLAALPLVPASYRSESQPGLETKTERQRRIVCRTLGRTGLKLPIVSMGVMNASDPRLVRAALDEGIVLLDTAHGYQGGRNEEMIGQVIRDYHRDSFVISTKIVHFQDHKTGLIPPDKSPTDFKADFRQKMDTTLKRLGVDSVDILHVHNISVPEVLSLQPLREVMGELKKEGKAHFLGVSFHQNEVAMTQAVLDAKIYDVILISYNFRQPHREEVRKAIARAAEEGLGIMVMKALAGVYWDQERKHPINAKAALKWVLRDENVHTTIPGITTFDQLTLDLSVMEDLSLTPQEEEDLGFGEKAQMTGLFCDQCSRCRADCRYHLDIPTAMRSYMYAYGYRHPAQAKDALRMVAREDIACRTCRACSVSCPLGLPVSDRLRDIVRVLDVPDEFLV